MTSCFQFGQHAIQKLEFTRNSIQKLVRDSTWIDCIFHLFKNEGMVADFAKLHNSIVQSLDTSFANHTKNRIANASVDIHTTYPFSPDAVYRIPLFFIWEYNLTWRAESLHFTTRSTLSGNSASTSFFRRRSRNGRRTLWRRLIIKSCSSSFSATLSWTPWLLKGVLNHSSKLFTLLKIFGKIKFSNAHSSGKLFYS